MYECDIVEEVNLQNQASFPAEHERVVQIDLFNDPRATVSSQPFCSNSPMVTQLKFLTVKKYITFSSPPLPYQENSKLPFPGD